MKYLLSFVLIFFAVDVFAQNIFNPIFIEEYTAEDSNNAIEYLYAKLDPKFPKDTNIVVEDITLASEPFKIISFYYSEYDGATRGESQYFISFWKDNKNTLTYIGSNLLNIYDPVITVSNNIVTIKSFKLYKPLSTYYYSFIYGKQKFFLHSILEISTDGDNKTNAKYYFDKSNTPVNINSISADDFIK